MNEQVEKQIDKLNRAGDCWKKQAFLVGILRRWKSFCEKYDLLKDLPFHHAEAAAEVCMYTIYV